VEYVRTDRDHDLVADPPRPRDTEAEAEAGGVAIGRPIANTQAFILDERGQPLPVGVPGELFLGGVGLAKGYRGRPQQTAERFIRVESVGGLLLYRTGDVGVREPTGLLKFWAAPTIR